MQASFSRRCFILHHFSHSGHFRIVSSSPPSPSLSLLLCFSFSFFLSLSFFLPLSSSCLFRLSKEMSHWNVPSFSMTEGSVQAMSRDITFQRLWLPSFDQKGKIVAFHIIHPFREQWQLAQFLCWIESPVIWLDGQGCVSPHYLPLSRSMTTWTVAASTFCVLHWVDKMFAVPSFVHFRGHFYVMWVAWGSVPLQVQWRCNLWKDF